MTDVGAFSILALTVSLSLSRPKVWRFRIHHSTAAVIGAVLTLVGGFLPWGLAVAALQFLFFPVITIVSLMIITGVAEKAGLFEFLANSIARLASGDGRKLFAYIFFTGTITGTIFTNDAAVLIFAPLVIDLIDRIQLNSWTRANKIPYYFGVLYIANLVGALTISNPINIVVTSFFHIPFVEYAAWMVLPAFASVIATYHGLKYFFRNDIPHTYDLSEVMESSPRTDFQLLMWSAIVLILTLLGFFTGSYIGVPTWAIAVSGAIILLTVYTVKNGSRSMEIIGHVGWDVIVFVVGIFIIARGLRQAGLTEHIANFVTFVGGHTMPQLTSVISYTAAVCSSIMNNHPTADTMAMVIRDLGLPEDRTRMLVFSALIGGDLGPKMLPIGSLAALLWFRILRNKGVHIPYSQYIRIGIPVTLLAILLSLLVLNLEYFLVTLW